MEDIPPELIDPPNLLSEPGCPVPPCICSLTNPSFSLSDSLSCEGFCLGPPSFWAARLQGSPYPVQFSPASGIALPSSVGTLSLFEVDRVGTEASSEAVMME